MQFLWRPFFDHLGKSSQIFTHVMYDHYSSPLGFRYDELSNDDPVISDPNMETFNA
jgi:hypothetical protein